MSQNPDTPSSFLGTGWGFPPSFGPNGENLDMVSGAQDIHQSLVLLLSTTPGERPMQESYGCDLQGLQFEAIDHHLINTIHDRIYDAVLRHEPRIELSEVDVTPSEREPGLLMVQITYRVLGTNSRYNMVYPFYVHEAHLAGGL